MILNRLLYDQRPTVQHNLSYLYSFAQWTLVMNFSQDKIQKSFVRGKSKTETELIVLHTSCNKVLSLDSIMMTLP